jgi:hypothetical protein
MNAKVVLLVAALVLASRADADRGIVGSEQDHSAAAITSVSCESSFNTAFTMQPAQVGEQSQHLLDLDSIRSLKVHAENQGGVIIRGWDQAHARMVVCRYAAGSDLTHAARILKGIQVSHVNGLIQATGPARNQQQAWWVSITLFLPRRTDVDVQAASGGIAVRNMRSRVTASSVSGGVSIAHSTGRHTIRTESGGITIDRVSGPVDAVSRDGSIAFKIGSSGVPALEARTAESGKILCVLDRCNDPLEALHRTSLRLGTSTPNVRLTTGTGSIHISSVKS